ncbi:TlpA disulfide reductase family protein [Flavicella sediminum]|uniref:TlpA disulfide reductase family protein n=1 Tax=Flavicella sediminum TaxID=2585141 RepID=UPI001122C987|nr:TlpA disulfide reductase family protein [Flavicella sediminum]
MKTKYSFLFALLMSFFSQAQFSIEGTLQPKNDELTWAMLYQMKDGRQHYLKNTKIKDGSFKFEIPEDSKKGMYRVVYRLKGEGFVDFLFNKENVKFSFDPAYAEGTSVFETSRENKTYQNYLQNIYGVQQYIDSLQVAYFRGPNEASEELYVEGLVILKQTQAQHESLSEGMLAHDFIKASQRYNSETISKSPQTYLKNIKENFFQHIDFENTALQESSFLVDRVMDYVFHINYSKDPKVQSRLYREAVENILLIPKKQELKRDLIQILIEEFVKFEETAEVRFLFENYYDLLPKELQKQDYKAETLARIAVSIGNKAPEITWEEDKKEFKLSELNSSKNYVVVFWSTGCSHCKKQLPEMYTYMKDFKDIAVIAVGLEEKSKTWKSLVKDFKGWHHVLGLNKWENETARSYGVTGTPSYFVLDKDKKIIAKPDNFRDLAKVLKNLN